MTARDMVRWCVAGLAALTGATARGQDAAGWAAAATAKKAALQQKMADTPGPLQRVRVDGFTAAGAAVKVSGVALTAETDAEKKKAEDKALDEALTTLLKAELAAPGVRVDRSGLTAVTPGELPHVAVQTAANAAKADDLLLGDSRFDAAGKLLLVGRAGATGARWLAANAAQVVAGQPATASGVSTAGVSTIDWPATPAGVQRKLAVATDPGLRQTRCDRVYYLYKASPAGPRRQVTVDGLKLGDGPPSDRELALIVKGLWPAGDPAAEVEQNLAPLVQRVEVRVPEPLDGLRDLVARTPALDGTRLDPGMGFDPAGRLALVGLTGSDAPADRERLETTVAAGLGRLPAAPGRPAPAALAARGVTAAGLRPAPVAKLATDLRRWATDSRDDVRIDRVYFDPAGRLAVTGGSPGDDQPAVLAEAKRLAAVHKLLPPSGIEAETVATLARFPAGLTRALRERVTADPARWAGVLIERGYFDSAGRYAARGAVDSSDQNTQLAAVAADLTAQPQWADYVAAGPATVRLDVLPLADLLVRFRQVAPAYPEFDGLRFERCRQEPAGGLVFEVAACGPNSLTAGGDRAGRLMKAHPEWKRRAAGGVTLAATHPAVTRSYSVSAWAVPKAVAAIVAGDLGCAREQVDTALWHDPDASVGWFLSAYLNQMTGDAEGVRRDLTRVIRLETDRLDDGSRQVRGNQIVHLQGPVRRELGRLDGCYRRALAAGLGPITLTREPLPDCCDHDWPVPGAFGLGAPCPPR